MSASPTTRCFRKAVLAAGCAIIGQTAELAPADKRFYAIRDVTATVESVPLITASILSKKLAAGLQSLVLDVKVGNGAFMAKSRDAAELATSLVEVANGAGLKTTALITGMNEPLASAAGNAVEVANAVDFLTGRPRDTRLEKVTLALAAEMLLSAGIAGSQRGRPGRARRRRWTAAAPRSASGAWCGARRPGRFRRAYADVSAERAGRAAGASAARRLCQRASPRATSALPSSRSAAAAPGPRTRSTTRSAHAACCRSARRSAKGEPLALVHARSEARGAKRLQRTVRAAYAIGEAQAGGQGSGRAAYCRRLNRTLLHEQQRAVVDLELLQALQEAHADQRAVERLVVEHDRLDVLDGDAADLQPVDHDAGGRASCRWRCRPSYLKSAGVS